MRVAVFGILWNFFLLHCSHLWMLAIYSILFGLLSLALNKGITTDLQRCALNKGLLQPKFLCLAQGLTAMGKASTQLKRPAGVLQRALKKNKEKEKKEEEEKEEKAAQKDKAKLKRPSAQGEGFGEGEAAMSLEDKIALFQKKGQSRHGQVAGHLEQRAESVPLAEVQQLQGEPQRPRG